MLTIALRPIARRSTVGRCRDLGAEFCENWNMPVRPEFDMYPNSPARI